MNRRSSIRHFAETSFCLPPVFRDIFQEGAIPAGTQKAFDFSKGKRPVLSAVNAESTSLLYRFVYLRVVVQEERARISFSAGSM